MKILKSTVVAFIISILMSGCTLSTQSTEPVQNNQDEKPISKYSKDINLDFIRGRFDPSTDSSFTTISSQYSDRNGLLMKKEAYTAFIKMYKAAQKDGVELVIRSAARNFDYQKKIWEKKWTGKTILSNGENAKTTYTDPLERAHKILEYSSMPGTSRHHWGTDIDFNSFNNEWFENGEGLKLFSWLENNAYKYGYCRPYTTKNANRPNGYNEEKWHWTYTPLSKTYTSFAKENLKSSMITGFKGSEVAEELDVITHFVLGINEGCKN